MKTTPLLRWKSSSGDACFTTLQSAVQAFTSPTGLSFQYMNSVKKRKLFLAGFAVVVLEECVAGDSQYTEQNKKLLEVYHTVLVIIQFFHDLVHLFRVIADLKQKQHDKSFTSSNPNGDC